jgi:hypothetical protein
MNMEKYVYQPDKRMSYEEALNVLALRGGHKIVRNGIDNASPHVIKEVLYRSEESGIFIRKYAIDIEDYKNYFQKAAYSERYPDYYVDNIKEKSLEHYLSMKFLSLTGQDIFIDIASEHSPVSEIYSRLTGARTYSQDIMYPEGIHGNRIGGDACAMPVPFEFATKVALTCSIEHFEGDADSSLFNELFRVLKVGGKVVVVPFYLFIEAATQTDPTISVPAGVRFDENCTIYCAEGWGNRHGRFYSPATLMRRIVEPMMNKINFDFYQLTNAADVDHSIYARFVMVGTKL